LKKMKLINHIDRKGLTQRGPSVKKYRNILVGYFSEGARLPRRFLTL